MQGGLLLVRIWICRQEWVFWKLVPACPEDYFERFFFENLLKIQIFLNFFLGSVFKITFYASRKTICAKKTENKNLILFHTLGEKIMIGVRKFYLAFDNFNVVAIATKMAVKKLKMAGSLNQS